MVDSLRAIPLFADLSTRDLERPAGSMQEMSFGPGDAVVTQARAESALRHPRRTTPIVYLRPFDADRAENREAVVVARAQPATLDPDHH
jgi:hypothetical protein